MNSQNKLIRKIMIPACRFTRLAIFLSIILFSSTFASAGPEVDRIGTFNGTTLWLGYNFGFSETYTPESETYNWMLYIAPEGLYVGLTSVRSLYSAVDVNAGGGLFYGSWAVPPGKLTTPGSGQPTGYQYITWSNMGSISGITITEEPFSTSLPFAGPLSGLGVGISMGPTFFREGSSNSLQMALQLNTIMSVSFALVPMPSFIPSVSLDKSGPGDTNLTGNDSGFFPVVLWNSPITMLDIMSKGTIQAIVDKLNSSASSAGSASLNGEAQTQLASFFSGLISGISANGQKISNFIDSNVIPANGASGAEVKQLISGAEEWLQTGNTEQAAQKLRELLDEQPFENSSFYNEMDDIESGVGLGFHIAYRNGYQWAVDNNQRDDNILYTDGIETVYCAIGSNCSIIVTTEEIYEALGLPYSQTPDIFEAEELHFSASMEKILASIDNLGTEDIVGIMDGKAEHTLSQNSGISQICNISMFLDISEQKFQDAGVLYEKVNLKSRKIYFLSAQQEAQPRDIVTITADSTVTFPSGQSIQWVQRFGPPVSLSGATTQAPSFTAPEIGANASLLVFDVTVGSTTYPNAGVINVIQPRFAVQNTVSFNPVSDYLTGVAAVGTDLFLVDIQNRNFRKINSSGQQTATVIPSPAMTSDPFDATYYNNTIYYTLLWGNAVYSMSTNGTENTEVFTTSFDDTTGICHDGTDFWIADQSTSPAKIYKVSNAGTTLTSFTSPVPNPTGMACDGSDLWITDNFEQKICRISTTGVLLDCYRSPGTQPTGIDFDHNGTLWNIDFDQSKLYKLAKYPTADSGSDATVNEGETVNLNGSVSASADGSILSYQWIQEQGPQVVLINSGQAIASFIAPNVALATSLSFRLIVTDGNNLSSSDNCTVTVNNTGLALQANPGESQIAIESTTVSLDGNNSTGAVGYTWKQQRGAVVQLESNNSAATTFKAPVVSLATSLVFELIVADGSGLKSSELVDVTVLPANLSGLIQLLQILSGNSGELVANYDFNGDRKVGLQDVLALMQSL